MENSYKLSTLKHSVIAICSVFLMEVFLGLTVNSLAIISDGLHALLDALTTLMLFVVTRASLKPPDEEHMYGHEKFESVGGLVGGLALMLIAAVIIYEAILKMLSSQTINFGLEYVGFIAIGYTLCIDLYRVRSFLRARTSSSTTMKAGFYHALADFSSTVIALLGFGLAALGFFYGDSIASIILGFLLTYLSLKLAWSSGIELTDTISKDLGDRVREEIVGTKEVRKCEVLKIRKAGEKAFVRATVQIPDYLSFEEAHDLSSKLESKIKSILGNADVVIHTEPSVTEMPTERLVEKLATEIAGVKEAHEVNVTHTNGKLYLTLHVYVDPELSVENAHQIAEEIEDKIEEKIEDVENVTVHVEPTNAKKRKGPMVQEDEIRQIVDKAAEDYQDAFRVRKIVTYVAGKKRFIDLDCSFTKQVTLEDAHKLASQIESKIHEHFSDTTVTVHVEPS